VRAEPLERPIGLLAAAVPRLTSLAVATHALHVLPDVDAALAHDVLAKIEATAADPCGAATSRFRQTGASAAPGRRLASGGLRVCSRRPAPCVARR
jgi:hypothetical protein